LPTRRQGLNSSINFAAAMTTVQMTILHVEDDPNDAMLFQHACGKAEVTFRLNSVKDGNEAIAYLRGVENFADRDRYPFPELVLLDLKMPRVSGFDVLS
jgi:CheY-like chemotaxis protein